MNYVGVDIRKKYSVLCAVDELGKKVREGRVAGNSEKGFARFFAQKHDQCFSLLQLFRFSFCVPSITGGRQFNSARKRPPQHYR